MFYNFVQNAQTENGGPGYKVPRNQFFKSDNPTYFDIPRGIVCQSPKFDFLPNFLYNIGVKNKLRRLRPSLVYPLDVHI